MYFQNRSVNLEAAARRNDSDATVILSQVKLADSTATEIGSPAFSLPLCVFRIIEWFGLEETLKIILFQHPAMGFPLELMPPKISCSCTAC